MNEGGRSVQNMAYAEAMQVDVGGADGVDRVNRS